MVPAPAKKQKLNSSKSAEGKITKPKLKNKNANIKAGSGKPRYIQKKKGKPVSKKSLDISESDIDSDEDFGLNGPEFGLLSDTSSTDYDEEGHSETKVKAAKDEAMSEDEDDEGEGDSDEDDEGEGDSDEDDSKVADEAMSEDDDDEDEEGSEEDEGEDDSDEDDDSSEIEVPEPEGSIEGDESDEEPSKTKKKRDQSEDKRTIFVGNLPCSVKKKKLTKYFSKFGKVESVRLRCPPIADPEVPKKVAAMQKDFHADRTNISCYVKFVEEGSVAKALKANGEQWDETHHIRVDRATGSQEHDPKKAVFIGGLPFDVEEDKIREIFEDCGNIVDIRVVRDRKTNVGKGFAFVNFAERHSVQLAVAKNGEIIGKKAIRVSRSDPKESRKTKIQSSRQKSVFVGNLPFDVQEEQLNEIFADCGEIFNIRVMKDHRTKVGKGFAYINFVESDSVSQALTKDGTTLGKRPIRVKVSTPKTELPPKPGMSQKYFKNRQDFIQKTFKKNKKNRNKNDENKSEFQGETGQKKEKKVKRKKNVNQKKQQNFVEVLNSKPKKPKGNFTPKSPSENAKPKKPKKNFKPKNSPQKQTE